MPVWRPFSKLDLRNQFGSEPHAVFHFLPCQRPLRPLFFWQVDERAGIVRLAEAGKLGAPLVQYPAGFLFTPGDLEKVETTLRWFYDYPKVVDFGTRAGARIAPRRMRFSKKIERAKSS